MVAVATLGMLCYVVSLYAPSIFSDYGLVQFGMEFDCDLKIEGITINLVEPPDAYISVLLSGFSQPECAKVKLIDRTNILKIDKRGIIDTVKYSDHVLEDIPGHEFPGSLFHVSITKARLRELYTKAPYAISDQLSLNFWAPLALIRTSYSRAALPVFPAIAPGPPDYEIKNSIRIIVMAPPGYIFSSSVPHQPKHLLSREDGVIEAWYDFPPMDPGFVVYFENARGGAIGELVLFFASGAFGFSFGFFVDRLLINRVRRPTRICARGSTGESAQESVS